MDTNILKYVDELFYEIGNQDNAIELKAELLSNMNEKYDNLICQGKNPIEAFELTTESFKYIVKAIKEQKFNLKEEQILTYDEVVGNKIESKNCDKDLICCEIVPLFSGIYWLLIVALFLATPDIVYNGAIYWICATVVYLVIKIVYNKGKKNNN